MRLLRSPDFEWTAERADDWRNAWPDFERTRYEAKAVARRPHVLLSDVQENVTCAEEFSLPRLQAARRHLPEPHHALGGRFRQLVEIAHSAASMRDGPCRGCRACEPHR